MQSDIVNPKTENRIERIKNGTYKVTIFCCKFRTSFMYYIKKYNPVLQDIIIDCVYDYCETGEIKFKMPKKEKNMKMTHNYIAKFIIQAIEHETKNTTFSRNVPNTKVEIL